MKRSSEPARMAGMAVHHGAPAPVDEALRRDLSVLGLWLLVVNGMIGAGIFGLPGEAARLAGTLSPWIFVVCAALILPVVLCFAELASRFGNTGGPVLYVETAFGPFAGFQAGWAFYVARLTAYAANLNLLVTTLGYFWETAGGGVARALLLLTISALLAVINVVGARHAMRWLGVLTALKFLPLLVVVGFGITHLDPAWLQPATTELPAASNLGAAVLLVIYAYVGFESGLVPAGEARRPERDVPRALLAAVAAVSLLYALIQWVCVAVLPDLATAERPLVAVGEALLGTPGAVLVMAGIAVSVGGNLLGSVFSAPRVTYRLALDGLLPRWFGTVHPRLRTPAWSIAFYASMGFLFALKGSFAWLAALSVLTRILLYLGCIAAIPRLRTDARTKPDDLPADAPSTSRGRGVMVPTLAAAICLGLLTQVRPDAWLLTALFLGAGSALYLIARRRNRPLD